MAFRDVLLWVKDNPLIGVAGVVGPILALIVAVPNAWDAATNIAGLPTCVFYANVYYYNDGHFKDVGGGNWVEYQPHAQLKFEEIVRNRDYINLKNLTPREDPRWASMLVRLPSCGGTAQWTYENPEAWTNLFQVFATVSPALKAEQDRYEVDAANATPR